MPAGQGSSETPELRQKRLARERNASLRKRKKIDDVPETLMPAVQGSSETPKLRQKRLAREKKASSRKGKRTSDESSVLEARMPSGINNGIPRYELGRMDQVCVRCGAKFWMEEKDRNSN